MVRKIPDIPIYTEVEVSWLNKAINPKFSVVLPLCLWNNNEFRELKDGAKLLYGIICSKIARNEVVQGPDDSKCVKMPVKEIERLLCCSKKKAQSLLSSLDDAGYIVKHLVSETGSQGQFNIVSLPDETDSDDNVSVVIPLSLFRKGEFWSLPDGAKLLYGIVYAELAQDEGYLNHDGMYYTLLPAEKFQLLSGCTKDTQRKYINLLIERNFITERKLGRYDIVLVRHLGKDADQNITSSHRIHINT